MASAEQAARLLREFHSHARDLDDDELDAALGLDRAGEAAIDLFGALREYGHQRLFPDDMPYSVIRELYQRIPQGESVQLLDIGSGYGRIVIYGALLFGVQATGIEIMRHRAEAAEISRRGLGLRQARFVAGNALELPWPSASFICMMNSFLPSLRPAALERLRQAAGGRRVAIAAVSTTALALLNEGWIRELPPPSGQSLVALPGTHLHLFQSRAGA